MQNWELLAKYLAGECSEKEAQEVKKWMEESSEQQQEFQKMNKVWEHSEENFQDFEPNVDKAFQNIQGILKESEDRPVRSIKPRASNSWLGRVAAVFILGLGIAWGLYQLPSNQIAMIENYNTQAQAQQIVLSDGSTVWLQPQSRLRYPEKFSDTSRALFLEGEAFFEVQSNPQKPFILETQNTVVQVLGTSFNVRALLQDTLTTVNVVSGRVQFQANETPEEKVVLNKGMKAVFNQKSQKLDNPQTVNYEGINWKTGTLTFRNTQLSEVIQVLKLYHNINIQFKNDAIKNCVITTVFKNRSIEESLEIIESTLGTSHSLENGIYFLDGSCL